MRRRLCVLAAVAAAALGIAAAASAENYIVLYKGNSVPSSAGNTIAQAGGSLLWSYDQIGVAIASSSSSSFRDNLLAKDNSVDGVAGTTGFATNLGDTESAGGPPEELPNAPASDTDNLSPLQWDMRQIHTPEAHAITGGSPAVLVGDIDTGLDYTHPDLAPNVDGANSVNCLGGVPVQGAVAANDDNGHGTHTAGTVAAAANGLGIVGVAPNVHIAGIKAGNAAGFFFPEAVVCAFVWAGTHHFDVTNNSYFADPFLFNCRNDPVQRAIWKAEQRAILFAEQNGVTVVAAEGNESEDTAHPTMDLTSPDDTTPVARTIHNDCVIIPVEVPGVIGVTAVGHNMQSNGGYLKSFYSSFGVGVTQVTAPGGDSRFGLNAEAPNGRVLSTWPAALISSCPVSRRVIDPGPPSSLYCYQQGTSMASPHVAGTAALIISRFGDLKTPQNGKMQPNQVKAYLTQTADPQPCPGFLSAAYLAFRGVNDGQVQSCQGGPSYNSWYGNGQVNAFNAVTHTPGS
jgi:subtilisin family serine protease